MQIKDHPDFQTKAQPITFSPGDTVQAALDIMCEKNIGSIVVINPDRTLSGLVTERDMMIRVLGKKLDPQQTQLSSIMSTDLKVARQDDELVDWLYTMLQERFRHLPIVDDEGKLVNLVSQGDFVAYTYPDLHDKIQQDIKGRIGKAFPVLLLVSAVITLGLIALKL